MLKEVSNIGKTLTKSEMKQVKGSNQAAGCNSDCDCWYSHGGNQSFGYVCDESLLAPGGGGTCVLGIYLFPPCGF